MFSIQINHLALNLILILICWECNIVSFASMISSIENLKIEGDYRSIRLQWTYNPPNDSYRFDFQIKLCELNNWNHRNICKTKFLYQINVRNHSMIDNQRHENDDPVLEIHQTNQTNQFKVSILGLRVQTSYSVLISPVPKNADENSLIHHEQKQIEPIIVTTKGFSAKTSRCLANSSEIEVFTGPYFNGKILVEGIENPSCILNGDRKNRKESYIFVINHDQCKSKTINNTRIESVVIVNENREIMTHHSRRYVVICGFDPDRYTLTASVSMPNFLLKKFHDRYRERSSSPTKKNQFDSEASLNVQNEWNSVRRYPVYIENQTMIVAKKFS
ncbi:hypothetical protein SSS_08497 [Sarcoptes scabiei]|uniref:ZP domain-containing protein n=1 Tax=Sarcoptes scabiei TaxID=52283 RepID=A0A834R459_SARSC|nr:hypothetical protein SSS_08497 [Sarcoptes scabiei]